MSEIEKHLKEELKAIQSANNRLRGERKALEAKHAQCLKEADEYAIMIRDIDTAMNRNTNTYYDKSDQLRKAQKNEQ